MVRTYDESIADKLEQLAPNSQADQEQYLDFMLDTHSVSLLSVKQVLRKI